MIKNSLDKLLALCDSVPDQIRRLGEHEIDRKPTQDRWSKKEIIGHLCDSAFVNIQRLIRGQVETEPQIFYDQDKWVNVQNYTGYNPEELITLWFALNKHFYHIAISMSEQDLKRVYLDREGNKLTLKFLIDDYLIHLMHHLSQII